MVRHYFVVINLTTTVVNDMPSYTRKITSFIKSMSYHEFHCLPKSLRGKAYH